MADPTLELPTIEAVKRLNMSSQRGNLNRSRGQKHQNATVFKNNKYDKSKRTKQINDLEVAEVCKRCQDVIAWKIKYKKYKLLSQPKTCTKCHLKKIKEKLQTMAQLEAEVKALSERKRRAYYRYMDKLSGKKKKKKPTMTESSEEGKEGDSLESADQKEDENEEVPVSLEEYFRNAREKLEELQKKMEEDIFDDFDDLDICGSSEDEFDDVDDDEDDDDCDSESDHERANNS
ncbi:uncharacterized protein C9orf85 homolog isoform X3 [Macrobrachium nipponense]|uniref:uncharacterized protein C9orf85 homolog isoform X3 n=1 Tax=Macrobrachium nipponense TaxID=159736 RepID=UPI0030C889F7